MTASKLPLIVPVENQVREFDPKLLLACVAARRGFSSIIGSHRKIDLGITAFPRSLYLCKSFTAMNRNMFRIIRRLGHEIVSWDEEALVHLPPAMYFSRRLSPDSLKYVSHLFAWGDDNAALWRQYPQMPAHMPIHVTGNPRADLLRPEIREYYRDAAEALRARHGEFILVNTNFNHVNACYPAQNLFRPGRAKSRHRVFGKAAKGMSREFATALRDHKQALFEQFKSLLPALEQAFPTYRIVVRPHPTESQEAYRRIAARCRRVTVSNEGNVVAWLMAARALIHNGCTTAVEAFVLGVPAISYRPRIDEGIDQGFYHLPNRLSHECFGFDELEQTLARILDDRLGPPDGLERHSLVDRHLAARTGALACERIVDTLESIAGDRFELPDPSASERIVGRTLAYGRRLVKGVKTYLPGSHAPPAFHRHRYPGIALAELRASVSRFQQVLGDSTELKLRQLGDQIFQISA